MTAQVMETMAFIFDRIVHGWLTQMLLECLELFICDQLVDSIDDDVFHLGRVLSDCDLREQS